MGRGEAGGGGVGAIGSVGGTGVEAATLEAVFVSEFRSVDNRHAAPSMGLATISDALTIDNIGVWGHYLSIPDHPSYQWNFGCLTGRLSECDAIGTDLVAVL